MIHWQINNLRRYWIPYEWTILKINFRNKWKEDKYYINSCFLFLYFLIMQTTNRIRRWIESNWWPLLLWCVYILILYITLKIYKLPLTGNSSLYSYLEKYGMYIPGVIGLLSILKSYILIWIFWIFRLHPVFSRLFTYILIYGFWMTLWVQLYFFEPRFTEIAIILIDTYSFPLMISSGITIWCAFILSFPKKS